MRRLGLRVVAAAVFAPCLLFAQERGANALGEAVRGLGVSARVLMIGAHPDDEETYVITWLSRGRHVETAYLSLTRGDGGQNEIGNELGEALGVVRTEELLAARRVDHARQYFTRAYDFGYSKNVEDVYAQWPKDTILGDVVRVVRAFRPHVVLAVFSGTPRDGHGQHQVAGLLAREAYAVADDTARFPRDGFGAPWRPLKLYQATWFRPELATMTIDVGEFSPLLGRSYAEIAGESRSQHKSQGFGAPQRKGPVPDYLRREATRVNESTDAKAERSIFDGIDTSWARFREQVASSSGRAALDSLPAAYAAARAAFDPFDPATLIPPLTRVRLLLRRLCGGAPTACAFASDAASADLQASIELAWRRVTNALVLASGIEIETSAVETIPTDTDVAMLVTILNRGRDTVAVSGASATGKPGGVSMTRLLAPHAVLRDTVVVRVADVTQPWWLAAGRSGAVFTAPASVVNESRLGTAAAVAYGVDLGGRGMGELITITAPATFRVVDPVKGEVSRLSAGTPLVTVTLEDRLQYVPANQEIDRQFLVQLRTSAIEPTTARVRLTLPRGLTADSATRTVRLEKGEGQTAVAFRVRGRLPAGDHRIVAHAESGGRTYSTGYQVIDYDHIRRQRMYRPAETRVLATDVRVPAGLRVGYVVGVSDNVAPALQQLGVPVTVLAPADLARTDLSRFSTIVLGPRAYEAHPRVLAANARLLEFARRGGTLVVQYGQYEMTQPGVMPYPITINRPHDRVTQEGAPVTILDAGAREFRAPNRITPADFSGWVQERSLYMPRTFDDRYRALLSLHDPGEPPNRGAILVTPLGRGQYVYTTLSFFRQLPAGVPGAARLFVNLLSVGQPTTASAAP